MTTISSFRNWLRTKIYQFEVTFGVYMYTHAEKFAFCKFPPSPDARPSRDKPPRRQHPGPSAPVRRPRLCHECSAKKARKLTAAGGPRPF